MMRIENRKDLLRDSHTGAVIYQKTQESRQREKISRLESEIHTLKNDIEAIKSLLERLVNGR